MWIACAPARPPLSNPIPERRVFRLDDLLHCRSTYIIFHCQFCLHTFLDQGVVAGLCQCHGSHCDLAARTACRVGDLAGLCLKIGSERIAHTGYKQSCRCFRDDVRVYQNKIRVSRQPQILFKYAVIRIYNRQSRAWRVCRCDGRADDDRCFCVISHSPLPYQKSCRRRHRSRGRSLSPLRSQPDG